MVQIFGDYIEPRPSDGDFLRLIFSASDKDIGARWSDCRLSAQYVADYAAEWFADRDPPASRPPEDFKDAVNFAANELLENALKYAHDPSRSGHSLRLALLGDGVRLYLCNQVGGMGAERFQAAIENLLSNDPADYYASQIERNAHADDATQSGLGLVTIVDLHDGTLAWKFSDAKLHGDAVEVTTMVSLPR